MISERLYQVSQVPTPHSRSTPMIDGSATRAHRMLMNPLANHQSET